jgi:hypothetical protein
LKLQEILQKIAIFPAKYSTPVPVRSELFRDEQRLISGQALTKIPVIMEVAGIFIMNLSSLLCASSEAN